MILDRIAFPVSGAGRGDASAVGFMLTGMMFRDESAVASVSDCGEETPESIRDLHCRRSPRRPPDMSLNHSMARHLGRCCGSLTFHLLGILVIDRRDFTPGPA